jgi:hypothetical protein
VSERLVGSFPLDHWPRFIEDIAFVGRASSQSCAREQCTEEQRKPHLEIDTLEEIGSDTELNSGLTVVFEEHEHDGMDQHDLELLTRNRRSLGEVP